MYAIFTEDGIQEEYQDNAIENLLQNAAQK